MKLRTHRWNSLMMALCEAVVGILLLINPAGFTKWIIILLGVVLLAAGIASIIRYFRAGPAEAAVAQDLAKGLTAAAGGLFCILNSQWFIVTFPLLTVVYGIVTLVMGILKVQWTVDMFRLKTGRWVWMGLSAAVTIVFATIILWDPFSTTVVLWMFVAITLIVEAVVDLIAVIFSREPKAEGADTHD